MHHDLGTHTKNCRKYDCYPTIETFFSTCPPLIRNYLTLQTIPAGQLLIQAGAPCGTVYILVSGRLQAIEEKAGEIPYSFFDLSPFDIVGDYELFSEDAESYVTVRAWEPSACLTIPGFTSSGSVRTAPPFLPHQAIDEKAVPAAEFQPLLPIDVLWTAVHVRHQPGSRQGHPETTRSLKLNREFLAAKTGCSSYRPPYFKIWK
ncbi:Crp/Fnr family transcriptional regulator [Enterocloster sp.]|uniref:Crp/Fnr family transcriptional regulator n=1 Tax=Enterocloster sp. TaxID=2719315 RepID=UPI0039A08755